MQNRLFFICPTDGLEPIINRTFKGRNYYYTSLGDSVVFDHHTVWQIKRLIRKHNIKEIFFVLSSHNSILLDAFGNQEYEEITRLTQFYKDFKTDNKYSMVLSHIHKNLFSVLSSHLNHRVKDLERVLNQTRPYDVKIGGKIFNTLDKDFQNVRFTNLIWKEHFHLN